MKNIGLEKYKYANVENFTSDFGIKIRRKLQKPFKLVLKCATKREIILERYPMLEKNKPYIFASTHSFDEDIISALATLDRNAYVLIGTTDQLEHNPTMYAAWANGMIYVDRMDSNSRKDSIKKMLRILESGSSILIFPEGGWNNTENLLVQKLFAGPYILSKETGIPIVPISTFNEHNSKKIYIKYDEPFDISNLDKKEALRELRDIMATMMYEQIEKYSTPIKRNELSLNARYDFMEERKNEYMRVNWTRDVWDEELTVYKDFPSQQDIRESLDNVEITKDNAYIFAPVLVKRLEDEKYNFKKYMHENWQKKI